MSSIRVSTVGQERRTVDFTQGESLGQVFNRIGVDIPSGSGVEVWINGEQATAWTGHLLADNDAIVLMPQLKGAKAVEFLFRRAC